MIIAQKKKNIYEGYVAYLSTIRHLIMSHIQAASKLAPGCMFFLFCEKDACLIQ